MPDPLNELLVYGPELVEADDIDRLECTDCDAVVIMDSDDALDWDTHLGDDICEACMDNYYSCTMCMENVHCDSAHDVSGDILCQSCYEEEAITCRDCNSDDWRDQSFWVEIYSAFVCHRCADEYFFCEGCEYYYPIEH